MRAGEESFVWIGKCRLADDDARHLGSARGNRAPARGNQALARGNRALARGNQGLVTWNQALATSRQALGRWNLPPARRNQGLWSWNSGARLVARLIRAKIRGSRVSIRRLRLVRGACCSLPSASFPRFVAA